MVKSPIALRVRYQVRSHDNSQVDVQVHAQIWLQVHGQVKQELDKLVEPRV
jgi:hypothetical protein